MDNKHITYFLQICNAGSISKAASSLYMSQQALSKSMDALEQELGVPLLVRTRQGIKLTQYGEVLLEEGKDLIKQYKTLEDNIKSLKKEYKKTVSIAFYCGMLKQIEPGFMEDFVTNHPEINFRFFSYLDNQQERDYFSKDADVVFSTHPLHIGHMECIHSSQYPLHLMMCENHALAQLDAIKLDDLKNVMIINHNSDSFAKQIVDNDFVNAGITMTSELGDSEAELIRYLILHQNAITFFAGPQRLVPKGCVLKKIVGFERNYEFYIYKRQHVHFHVIDELIEEILCQKNNFIDEK